MGKKKFRDILLLGQFSLNEVLITCTSTCSTFKTTFRYY